MQTLSSPASAETIIIKDQNSEYSLSRLKMFAFPGSENQKVTIDNFISVEGGTHVSLEKFPQDQSNRTLWTEFNIANESDEKSFTIELDNPHFRHMNVWVIQDGSIRHHHLGEMDDGSYEKPLTHIRPVLPISIEKSRQAKIIVYVETYTDIVFTMKLKSEKKFSEDYWLEATILAMYFGAVFIICIYNAFVYFSTRNNHYLLYVAYSSTAGIFFFWLEGYFYRFFATINTDFVLNLGPALYAVAIYFLGQFSRKFLRLKETPRIDRIVKWLTYTFLFLSVCAFATYDAVRISRLVMAFMFPLLIFAAIYRVWNGAKDARYYLLAFMFFLVGSVIQLLRNYGLFIGSEYDEMLRYSMHVGTLSEISLFSFALASKIKILQDQKEVLFDKIKSMNENLEKEVGRKTKEVRSLLDSIHQGIIKISEGSIICNEHSKEATTIIGEDKISGRNFEELYLEKFDLGYDDKAKIRSCLEAALGESEFNFEVNQDHLPREVKYHTSEKSSIWLALDWGYELNDDKTVDSIVLSYRDVTELIKLRHMSQKAERENNIILDIIAHSKEDFFRFMNKAESFIAENIKLIKNSQVYSEASIKVMFINIHTLKGHARYLGLSLIKDGTHLIEQEYSNLINDRSAWNQRKLLGDMENIAGIITEYKSIAENKLSWKNETSPETCCFDRGTVKDLIHGTNRILQKSKDEVYEIGLKLYETLTSRYYHSLELCLKESLLDIERLAKDLNKPHPQLHLSGVEFRITPEGENILHDVMVHILRNIMDHGIESPDIRRAKGKDEIGNIHVSACIRGTDLIIEIYDDGQGIAIDRVIKKAIAFGLIKNGFNISDVEAAKLIFHEGISTASSVTEISGRGVGMGAVKKFLETNKGGFDLVLQKPYSHNGEKFIPIRLQIKLNKTYIEESVGFVA
ncbi:MAG TPA: 7TM diverse intracellular signaling domain-containing protein [Oligoflexus sp.]|uniref:7TM diverse intracellular signaling domain-containing protein n=1 Tax=Oligoflexus sp. TaxID=1971216 RepID=UPI002D2458F0|nr:7TM diverse intracellular signaling domain-containing protein [Oligoflexus sp.]HYX34724.1 7TM diverse intracellular signaling domain-containing protein [Oligoflexus sp.]